MARVPIIPDQDWMRTKRPLNIAWPWPTITTVEALREKLREIQVPVRDFKLTQVYRRNLGRHPWLNDL